MSAAQPASHDRKRIFCDFLWRILLTTHGWGRMKSQTVRAKLDIRDTSEFGGFKPVGLVDAPGGDDEDSELDINLALRPRVRSWRAER